MKKFILLTVLFFCCCIISYSQPGSLDFSFGNNGIVRTDFGLGKIKSSGTQVLVHADGAMYVVASAEGLSFIAKIFPDGSRDSSYGINGYSSSLDLRDAVAAIQSDGKIVMAGSAADEIPISSVDPLRTDFGVVRYNTDGILDSSFNGDGKLTTSFAHDDYPSSVVIQNDGRIVVFGLSYPQFFGEHFFAIGSYNSDGSLDDTFNSNGMLTYNLGEYFSVQNVGAAVQNDGKIVVGATGLNSENFLLRLNRDGTVDNSFSNDGKLITNFDVNSIAIKSDGKILVGGSKSNGTNQVFVLARFNPDGNPDNTFDNDGELTTAFGPEDSYLTTVAIEQSGKIVATGYTIKDTNSNFTIARYNTDGSLDNTLSGDGKQIENLGIGGNFVNATTIQSDGKIAVGYTDSENFAVARFNTDGSFDNTFDKDGKLTNGVHMGSTYYTSTVIQSDEKLLAVGYTLNGGNYDFALARYNTDGSLDNTFSGEGKQTTDFGETNDTAHSVAIQSDGKIVVAGSGIARYNPDGSLDAGFGSNGTVASGGWNSVVLQSDGKIVVAGSSIARFNSDGSPDGTFASNVEIGRGNWLDMAVQKDGKMVVVGKWVREPDKTVVIVARYNTDGSLDNTFSEDGTTDFFPAYHSNDIEMYASSARAVAIQEDGRIVVAGNWSYNYKIYTSFFAIARYNSDGNLDTSFSGDGMLSDIHGYATSLAIQSDGKIVAGGGSDDIIQYLTNLKSDFAIVCYNNDGSLDSSFSSDGVQITPASTAYDIIQDIEISNNKLYAVGHGQFPGSLGIVARYLLQPSASPFVIITSPTNNTTYVGPAKILLIAEANDVDGRIKKVQFFNGTTLLATQNFFPYTYTWHNRPPGNYSFTAQATDNKGIVTTSDIVHVTVLPNKAPSVSITSPANNTNYVAPAAIRLVADAKDEDGTIKKVQFYNGTTLIATQNYFPYALTWYPVAAGTYALTAKAIDDKGMVTTSDIVRVTVTAPNDLLVNKEKIGNGNNAKLFSTGSLSLKASPVPAKNILNIYTTGFERNKKLTISVVDVSGVVIKIIQRAFNPTMQMDVSSLKPGVYFLKVISDDKTLYTRFVKL